MPIKPYDPSASSYGLYRHENAAYPSAPREDGAVRGRGQRGMEGTNRLAIAGGLETTLYFFGGSWLCAPIDTGNDSAERLYDFYVLRFNFLSVNYQKIFGDPSCPWGVSVSWNRTTSIGEVFYDVASVNLLWPDGKYPDCHLVAGLCLPHAWTANRYGRFESRPGVQIGYSYVSSDTGYFFQAVFRMAGATYIYPTGDFVVADRHFSMSGLVFDFGYIIPF